MSAHIPNRTRTMARIFASVRDLKTEIGSHRTNLRTQDGRAVTQLYLALADIEQALARFDEHRALGHRVELEHFGTPLRVRRRR